MKPGLRGGCFVFLLCLAGAGARAAEAPSPASASSPFQDIPFDAALKQAAQEHKVVFVDFFTTWCGPCKMLDSTTWKDPAVIALLREKAVALRLDAEKEAELAKRYHVQAYPTMALIKPDGTEIDALVGYRDAKAFQADFAAALAGKTSFLRAQEAVEKAQGDADKTAQARYQLGQELARSGKDKEALAEYIWCYDVGMVQAAGYAGVRNSFLTASLGGLGKHYPPALEALRTRRDAAKAKMESDPSRQSALDFAALNDALGENQATLDYFDKLPPGDRRRDAMGFRVFGLLLQAKRYGDAAAAHPYSQFKETFSHLLTDVQGTTNPSFPQQARDALRGYAVRSGAEELEVLAGAGKDDDARDLLKTLLDFDKTDATRATVREHLARAGRPELLK